MPSHPIAYHAAAFQFSIFNSNLVSITSLGLKGKSLFTVSYMTWRTRFGQDSCSFQPSVFPCNCDFEIASGAQPFYRTVLPSIGQGWQ